MYNLQKVCQDAKIASKSLISLPHEVIVKALNLSAKKLRENVAYLKSENAKDIALAKELGKSDSFIDRLLINEKVVLSIAEGIEQVASLPNVVNKIEYEYKNEVQNITVEKRKVPFGLIGMIYEARPNVTADAFALAFKTKNAIILKGGKEAINSNMALVKIIKSALTECGVDSGVISLIEDVSRETTLQFVKMDKYVDLIIPRGSQSLINFAVKESTIPIIETGVGNCHIYIDESANVEMATEVVFNAKTQRYSVCNACESLVIHSKILKSVLPSIYNKLREKQVEMRVDERAKAVLGEKRGVVNATAEDFYTEYGDAIISVKTVDSLEEAINHINEHSSKHSESIITSDMVKAKEFQEKIDSSCVYVNASTRFSDGFVFGLGAEIGISTQKLHARGPMGLEALLTTKYFVKGEGSVRK